MEATWSWSLTKRLNPLHGNATSTCTSLKSHVTLRLSFCSLRLQGLFNRSPGVAVLSSKPRGARQDPWLPLAAPAP